MGYTHYYTITGTEKEREKLKFDLPIVKAIVEKYKDILSYNGDIEDQGPVVREDYIFFNGIEDDAHETFCIAREGQREFCKTARKPYDIAVCMILLVLSHEYPENIKFGSDGLYMDKNGNLKDKDFIKAVEELKTFTEFGYDKIKVI